ncbi:MAG TPA: wax ester/triacylglycerol synthase family O-acyltransferase [Candidatus Dormibacteraeota bacterium]
MAIEIEGRSGEALSRADLAWLHADEPTNHFIVTSLALFDKPLVAQRFKTMLSQRIGLHPRLRQVVTRPLNPLAAPRWTPAADFDLDAHIHRAALPGAGDTAALAAYIGDLVGRPLDVDRPLWECHIVDGPGSGGALITRFHHSLGDGQAMVRMLLSLTDDVATGWKRPLHGTRPAREHRPAAPPLPSLPQIPDVPLLARAGIDAVGTLARLTLLDPDPPTALRGGLTLVKRVAWSRPLSLAAVKDTARAAGTTVNDVIVSVIAGSLGSYLRKAGQDTRGLRIRAMVPVNMRAANDSAMAGNRFSLVYLELPLGVMDARERLMRVKIEMDRIKASKEPVVGWLLVQGLGLLPAPLEHIASAFYADKASLVLTNVIGPARRIYLAGSPIEQMTFWEPESGGLGLGISIYSYAGQVTIGVVSDRNLVAEPHEITEGVEKEFAELASA